MGVTYRSIYDEKSSLYVSTMTAKQRTNLLSSSSCHRMDIVGPQRRKWKQTSNSFLQVNKYLLRIKRSWPWGSIGVVGSSEIDAVTALTFKMVVL